MALRFPSYDPVGACAIDARRQLFQHTSNVKLQFGWYLMVRLDRFSIDVRPFGVRTEYCHLPCQIRMDWLDPHQGIVDLKTCDDLTWFEPDARRYPASGLVLSF